MQYKKFVRLLIGLAISIALLYFSFHNIKWSVLYKEITSLKPIFIVLYVLFIFFNCFFRTLLWKVTTFNLGKAKFIDLFGGVITGLLVNNFLPFRIGEIYRTYYLSSKTNFSKVSVLSTIGMERVLDVLSLFTLFFIGMLLGLNELNQRKTSFIIIVSIFLIIAILVILFFLKPILSIIQELRIIPQRIKIMLHNLIGPVLKFSEIKYFFIFFILCVLIWASLYFSIFFLIISIGPDNFKAAYLLLIFLYLGLLIPASPGGLGIVQIAFIFGLSFFGISKELALSYSIIYQGLYYIVTIILGIPFIISYGLKGFFSKKESIL